MTMQKVVALTRFFLLAAVVLGTAVHAGSALAVTPQEILADKALEHRAREISGGLRCLVCQNQSIDDSDAPLAHDLRVLVRERLTAGDSDEQVRDFVVARYGEFVLLKPPFSAETLLLWFMPLIAIFAAAGILWTSFRPRETASPSVARSLSPEENAALETLMRDDDTKKS
ncbi:cytochrome c-type biogenesis protein [Hyphomicrobium sp.]|uniref:cytochrome c-type biogenesis protein n=1 Tax=Hyphomicrobium sp. TaxID=82 RepID=UPI003F723EDD